jgi:putative ABC transport system permease protein
VIAMRALDRKLWRELWAMRGQMLAIAAVIVSGVATLVMSLSTLDSLDRTRELYYRDYGFADVFASLKRAPRELAARIAALPGVDLAETRVVAAARLEVAGFAEPVTGRIVSLPDRAPARLNRLHLRAGRLPEPDRANEAVVHETFAEAHRLAPGDRISAIVNGLRQALVIVGVALSPEYVYQIAPGALLPDFQRYGVLWMAESPLASAYGLDGAFNDVALALAPGASEADVIGRLDALLAPYGGAGAVGRFDQLSHHFLSEELRQLRTTATVFPLIFLGVAAFLLNVVVSRLIATQRDQIGILKAFGYGNAAIGWHYLKLVLLVALVGVAGGIALGIWFGKGLSGVYAAFYRFPALRFVLRPEVVGIALAVAGGAAFTGTLHAVRRATGLSPAEAMRPESPIVYRATLLERLGLQRLLSQPTRMIARHIERRPVRSLLSAAGVALACGVMIVGHFQQGAIDFMVDVQFGLSQREDLTVSFVEPAASRAVHALRALPGVTRVEGQRTAAVRLRHGHRSFRTAIVGIEPDSVLQRVLDDRLAPIAVPADGLLLTDHLADLLGVVPGDSVRVEALEGARTQRDVPVAGVTRQYLGVVGTMDRTALNRLLQEGDVVSAALIAVDRADRGRVYDRLKEMPRVAGIAVHESTIAAFFESMAEMVLTFSGIATLLGATIVFGVVYNTARIALSERSRELASLRVLGFRHGEVAYILLGELTVLVLAGVPLGFLVGHGLCAFLVGQFASDLYRIPLVVAPASLALAAAVAVGSAAVSFLMVWRRLRGLDLVAVLKTRE